MNLIKSVVFILFVTITPNISAQSTENGPINRLTHKCNDGDEESCETLIAIARTNPGHFNKKYRAIEKMSNQTVLAEIAKSEANYRVRDMALGHITNQDILADLAIQGEDFKKIGNYGFLIRLIAIEKISDKSILFELTDSIRTKHNFINDVVDLKLMMQDSILNKYFSPSFLGFHNSTELESYYGPLYRLALDISITVRASDYNKIYKFYGERGGRSTSPFDVGKLHPCKIDKNSILNDLFRTLDDKDIVDISENSNNAYLADVAEQYLKQ